MCRRAPKVKVPDQFRQGKSHLRIRHVLADALAAPERERVECTASAIGGLWGPEPSLRRECKGVWVHCVVVEDAVRARSDLGPCGYRLSVDDDLLTYFSPKG